MDALIDVQDMYKVYNPGENEVRALDGVSLQVYEGEFVAIIGHSGSGKSTLMNMLGCLDVPTKGTYILNNRDVSHLSDNELSEVRNNYIGFIFQGFNLIQNLTAIENVELPLIYRHVEKKERRRLAVEALKKVGLESRMKHKPTELSGGQQQRVAIARAIAAAPPLILADEPTGNLDSKSTKDIMKILDELNEQGNTIVLITHDDGIAANAKRVVRIMDGKIESDTGSRDMNYADSGDVSDMDMGEMYMRDAEPDSGMADDGQDVIQVELSQVSGIMMGKE
ncbi:MAG: ABC transporter ATP-binding protein [Clostridium sp.]|nr:ABC transporter ATP-binding protein [Clostridium sp.]